MQNSRRHVPASDYTETILVQIAYNKSPTQPTSGPKIGSSVFEVTGSTAWETPYPVDDAILVIGELQMYSRYTTSLLQSKSGAVSMDMHLGNRLVLHWTCDMLTISMNLKLDDTIVVSGSVPYTKHSTFSCFVTTGPSGNRVGVRWNRQIFVSGIVNTTSMITGPIRLEPDLQYGGLAFDSLLIATSKPLDESLLPPH
jgi:hypothetical protein